MQVWTPEQLKAFLRQIAEDRYHALWLFYILTGVRRREALALRWSDVDLDAASAVIRRSLVPVNHQLYFGEPKTARGRRRIALDPQLVQSLTAHRASQQTERDLMGDAYRDQDLVFAQPDGTPLHPETVSRWFAALTRSTGAPPMRLHDLRHLHASLARAAGVPTRVLADRLGHSTTVQGSLASR